MQVGTFVFAFRFLCLAFSYAVFPTLSHLIERTINSLHFGFNVFWVWRSALRRLYATSVEAEAKGIVSVEESFRARP